VTSFGAGHTRPGWRWKLALAGLVVGYVVLAGYDFIAKFGAASSNSVASVSTTISPSPARPTAPPTSGTSAPSASLPRLPPNLPAPASSPAPRSLTVASVAAFGPEGTSDGDNPVIVSRVNGAGTQPWYSSWYTTPEFGALQAGTGLLLDMGKAVTVSSVRLALGSPPGADVQLRVGNSASLAGLRSAARAAGVGGIVRLPVTAPASGRYVLVWFTRLPPDLQGTYQISVYSVTVYGFVRA
jgi:hypothetical protein